MHFNAIICINYCFIIIAFISLLTYYQITRNEHLKNDKKETRLFRIFRNIYIHLVPFLLTFNTVKTINDLLIVLLLIIIYMMKTDYLLEYNIK